MRVRVAFTIDDLRDLIGNDELEARINGEAIALTGREDFALGGWIDADSGVDWLDGDPVVWFDVVVEEKSMDDLIEDHKADLADRQRQEEKER